MVVACHRPQGDGERVHGAYLTLAAGVECDMLQERGKWVYRRQGLSLNTSCAQAGRRNRAHQRPLCRMLAGRYTMEVSVLSGQNAAAEQRRHGGPTFWGLLD